MKKNQFNNKEKNKYLCDTAALLSLYKSSEGDYQVASIFGEMFVISFISSLFLIVFALFIGSNEGKQQSQEIY